MPIPWYYTWSNRFFHEVLQDSMKDSAFTLVSIEHVNCLPYSKIVEALENSDKPYIIYSYSDIIVKSDIFKNLKCHIDAGKTMVFLDDESKPSESFMLLKVCSEVIDFFKKLSETIHIDELIKEYKGNWGLFDNQNFTSSTVWNMKNEFSIMKIQTSNLGKEFDFAEKIFTIGQHLNLDPYMQYVPEEIIPFIYKFQEILYLSHQEARTAGIL
jgi:hypothetical protein